MSITKRLSLIYASSALGMLLISVLSLYWVLVSALQKENTQLLLNQTNLIEQMLYNNRMDALVQEISDEPAFLEAEQIHFFSRVLDKNGRLFMQTPNMEKMINFSSFINLIEQLPINKVRRWHDDSSGKTYLIMTKQIDSLPSTHASKKWFLQTALDISREVKVITRYQRNLVIILSLGTFLSVLIGIITARKGLRPLRDITMKAERITVSQLHERISSSNWPQELISLATAFDNMLSRIEDSFKRLSQFSADLAHELRNPINNLMGVTEISLSRKRTPEEYQQVLESNLEEYGKLSRMIDSLLFLARADNSKAVLSYSHFDVRQILDDSKDFFRAIAEERNIEIACKGEASLNADPLLFKRVINNLLANALQNTPNMGSIVMEIEKHANNAVQIIIKDTGVGIAEPHLPKIFDRFYRVDSSRTQSEGGTGLGLAIVKSIIDLHKGYIAISSEVGKGTTVTLTLPA